MGSNDKLLIEGNIFWLFLKQTYNYSYLFIISGKGVSIWDTFSHQGKVDNNDTGDIACDTYHKYMDDIALLKNLKVIVKKW